MFYDRAMIAAGNSFFDYIRSVVGASGIYSVYSKIYFTLGKYLKISSFIKILVVIVKAAYSGTAAIFAFTALVVALPAAVLFTVLGAAAALFTRKKMIKEIDGAVSGTVFFIFGSAAGEYGRWLEENGTVMEITTSVFGRGTFGAVKKNSKRYAVHISGVYPIIKRLSLKNDIKIIKIY